MTVAVAAVAGAYGYSLWTLMRQLTLDSPLAYLSLVPIIALALALLMGGERPDEPRIDDRYVDYIIGVPLLAAALAILWLVPPATSTFYWLWRLDMLSLPLFAAGTTTILLGSRACWRLRLPVSCLFLAWPYPYVYFMQPWLKASTDASVMGLRLIVRFVPVATAEPGQDGVFLISNHFTGSFLLSVTSACAGANAILGFLIIGLPIVVSVTGSRAARLLWLGVGTALIWCLNWLRILLLFWVGGHWGQIIALDWLHPIVGLLLFNLALLGMVLGLRLFGLELPLNVPRHRKPTMSLAHRTTKGPVAAGPRWVAMSMVVAAAVVAGIANQSMRTYELVADNLGAPRIDQLSVASANVAGWSIAETGSFPWAATYFGSGATWSRFEYKSTAGPAQGLVVMDVISTSDLGTFSVYPVEACYRFHNAQVLGGSGVDLMAGVTGQALVYRNRGAPVEWAMVFWQWPVHTGVGQRYERVVLNMLVPAKAAGANLPQRSAPIVTLPLEWNSWVRNSQERNVDGRLLGAQSLLVAFARQIVLADAGPERQAGIQRKQA